MSEKELGDGLIQELGIPRASARSGTVPPDRRYRNELGVANEPAFVLGVDDRKVQIGFGRHEEYSSVDGTKRFVELVPE